MRFYEISGGFRVPVSKEEQQIIDLALDASNGELMKSDLDERQQEVARIMVTKGLLRRLKDEDHLYFKVNSEEIWRN